MARMNGLAYLGLGAALMYLFDPQLGRKRRNDLRNQAESTRRKVQRGADAVLHDATNRAHGALVETRQWLQSRKQRLERRAQDPANEAGHEAASRARTTIAPWRNSHWSPAQRALAGMAGAGLATSGYVRGGLFGAGMAITGLGLIARAAGNEPLGKLAKHTDPAREMDDDLGKPTSQIEGGDRPAPAPQRGDAGLGAAPA